MNKKIIVSQRALKKAFDLRNQIADLTVELTEMESNLFAKIDGNSKIESGKLTALITASNRNSTSWKKAFSDVCLAEDISETRQQPFISSNTKESLSRKLKIASVK